MKRILLLSISLAFLVACGPAVKKGCKDTGCSAGAVCNTNNGACEAVADASPLRRVGRQFDQDHVETGLVELVQCLIQVRGGGFGVRREGA